MDSPIRTARRQVGLTAADLATVLGVSTGTVASWERAEALPSRTRLERVAVLLGRDPDTLADQLREARVAYRRRIEATLTGAQR
jgi:transcriptional regulator with XRE-family HTH domain